ncbi:MAG: patatin-like phospholipase family protein [Actinomycetota bacterium]|nr:patatin-like phospholipase family protein [Actinomycetota bacterium]
MTDPNSPERTSRGPQPPKGQKIHKPLEKIISRLRHRDEDKKVVFILSGGANRGACQVGMLRALYDFNIRPDLILGASAGALNGVSFASNPTLEGIDHLEEVWRSMRRETILPPPRFGSTWRYAKKSPSVYQNDNLRHVIQESISIKDLRECEIPVEVVTTKLCTGEAVRFSSGDAVEVLLASTALPGTYPSITIGRDELIDGGVSDDIPLLRAYELGATQVYILYCSSLTETKKSHERPIEAILDSFSLAKKAKLRSDIALLANKVEITLIESPVASDTNWLDFSRSDALILDGYRSAFDAVQRKQLRQVIPTMR